MKLAELVAAEAGVSLDAVMLLRHSNESIRFLERCGASIEEYTSLQPVGSKYDYFREAARPIHVVVVIVYDHVYGVFRIDGVLKTGPSYEIVSPEYVEFDRQRDKPERLCHLFQLEGIASSALGKAVRGWEGRTRTPVQRSADSFFSSVEVEATSSAVPGSLLRSRLQGQVRAALHLPSAERARRLRNANPIPRRVVTVGFDYLRNPDVVAEVLVRAKGSCERCCQPAPFLRRSDRTPYLEVHHRVPLAQGGLDTVANAEALCPNCHRQAHYGDG